MKKHAGTRLMVVEVWYLSFNVLQIVGEQVFHSQSSLTEFLRFKSHLANLELSPVESYQSFDFVNFMLDGRPCFLQTDIRPLFGPSVFRSVSSSISGKCGPHIDGGGRESKE
jgi:hypothetical protein